MAYLALARKWRPKSFAEVVGQTHVVQALSNALDSGRIHHAFLFTGTRGVGKTTLARIFAKSLNCEEGTSAEPCQQCSTCVAVDEGRFVDLIEVDAASRTKVEETREMLENVHYAPTSAKYKVYLIDEVHMFSGHSFNALLKTLEEPPEHVKFLFATTDPQKVPVTVLSRCLQFNLRAMRVEQIENQLVKILAAEAMEYEQNALKLIARAADGSMRDGLSLLDQAIAQGSDEVCSTDVESMLGTIKSEHSQGIISALVGQDAEKIMQLVTEMADSAVDFSSAIDDVLLQLYYISLSQIAPSSLAACDVNIDWVKSMASQASPDLVQLFYQIGLHGKRDIALAPNLRVGFEMALLRMLAFEPISGDTPNANNDQADSVSPSQVQSIPAQTAPAQTAPAQTAPAQTVPVQTVPVQTVPVQTAPVQTAPVQTAPADAESTAIAVTLAGNNEWGELIEQTDLIGLPKELAMNCACERFNPDHIQISLAPKLKHLFKEDRLKIIEAALGSTSGKAIKLELEIEETDKETPAECLERLGHEQFKQTKQQFENDPGVKAIMSEFGATLNEQSIKPN